MKFAYRQEPERNSGVFSNFGGQIAADQFMLSRKLVTAGFVWWGHFGSDLELAFDLPWPPSMSKCMKFKLAIHADNAGLPAPNALLTRIVSPLIIDTGFRVNSGPQAGRAIYCFGVRASVPIAKGTHWLCIGRSSNAVITGNNQFQWCFSFGPQPNFDFAYSNTNPQLSAPWTLANWGNLAFGLVV